MKKYIKKADWIGKKIVQKLTCNCKPRFIRCMELR
jgi:hypothetical protein